MIERCLYRESLTAVESESNSLYCHQYDGTVIHKSCLQCLRNRRKQNRTLQGYNACKHQLQDPEHLTVQASVYMPDIQGC